MASLRVPSARVRTLSPVDAAFHVAVYAGFALFALLVFYPFWFVLINSLNGMLDYGVSLYLPRRWSLVNFEFAFREPLLRNSLMVSILRVAAGVTVMVVVNATCAFALRKRTLKLRKIYLAIFTIPLFFGGGLIPEFLNLKRFGLLDTFAVYILPQAWSFFFLVILMSAFNDIDDSIEESARMDGARSLLICLRIYLPMSAPIIAAIALFAGVHHWGAWFDAMYFVLTEELRTFSAYLIRLVQQATLSEELQDLLYEYRDRMNVQGVRFAAVVIAMVPVLLVYPFIQRFFVKGIRIGAIK